MAYLRLVPPFGAPIDVSQDVVVVGREPGCDILVNDGSVSRRHARIERRGAAWFVVDQGSANGTFLDSQRVADALLRPGQELRFGAVAFQVALLGDVETGEGTIFTPAAAIVPPAPAHPAHAPPAPAYVAAPPPAYAPSGPPPAAGGARVAPPSDPELVAPPPKRGKGPFFWVAAGCGGCLVMLVLGVALFIGGPLGFIYFATRGAADTVNAQIAEIKAGQLDAAYARLSDEYRGSVAPDAFAAFVERHPGLKQNSDTTFNNRSVNNDRAELRGSLTAASGQKEQVTYRLVKSGDDWRIAEIEVDGDRPGPGPVGETAPAGEGGLRVETIDVQKRRDGGTVRVTIRINVSGFRVRPQGGRFAIELAEDVQTLDPDGFPIEALTKADVQRVQRTTSMERGAVEPVTTSLTLDAGSPAGRYAVRLIVRDLVGGQQAAHEVSFELP